MSCIDKIENICVEPSDAKCTVYTGKRGVNPKTTDPCMNQHDVNKELYNSLDEIHHSLDTGYNPLEENCIEYPIEGGKVNTKDILITHRDEICTLKEKVFDLESANLHNLDITSANLDFKCLVDPCGDPITKLGQLLQIMINKVCSTSNNPTGGFSTQ